MLLAQQLSERLNEFSLAPLWEEKGIALAMMGIFVVFMALVLIVVFITVLPRLLAPYTTTGQEAEATVPVVAEEEIPDEILVVIAAAVAEAIDRPHRVVRIRGMTPGEIGWSLEGRMQHHHSHKTQQRGRR